MLGACGCSGGDDTTAVVERLEPTSPSSPSDPAPEAPRRYVLGSITIDPDNNRVSYAHIVDELSGHFTNAAGLEVQGNAVFLASGDDFFYGLQESPEWVRYSTRDGFRETGRLSFLNYGVQSMDYANVIVDPETAVSVLTQAYVAVVWNPRTMEVTGTIDLSHLRVEGLSLEAFTTVAHQGLVYVPGKWVDWEAPTVMQRVSMTVLDPRALEVVGVAEDDRCGAGGRVTFDERGYGYVMGDGRNQSMQVFARANGQPVVNNCLLRMAPGAIAFERDYFYEIPSLTGGLDAMTELEAADVGSGVGFAMMIYRDRVREGLDEVNFEHWFEPAYKRWRIELGDVPRAQEVQGASFAEVGFSSSAVDGKLYSPESDGLESRVYEIDPATNTAVLKFTMDGYFAGLHALAP